MQMPPDRTVVHATWTPGDIDCFALAPAATARTIDVAVDTPPRSISTPSCSSMAKPIAIANKGGKGVVEKLTAQVPANAQRRDPRQESRRQRERRSEVRRERSRNRRRPATTRHDEPGAAVYEERASPRESLWMRRARGPTILVVLALTNLIAYATRNALFAVYPDLRDRVRRAATPRLGLLTTMFLVPHAIATLPFGWAGDRYDRRRVIALGMMLASVCRRGRRARDRT